jgi:hypothetical protein
MVVNLYEKAIRLRHHSKQVKFYTNMYNKAYNIFDVSYFLSPFDQIKIKAHFELIHFA